METAAERLIDVGSVVNAAVKYNCKTAIAATAGLSLQKRVLALIAYRASREHPALMFRAIMEGWSASKIRVEAGRALDEM